MKSKLPAVFLLLAVVGIILFSWNSLNGTRAGRENRNPDIVIPSGIASEAPQADPSPVTPLAAETVPAAHAAEPPLTQPAPETSPHAAASPSAERSPAAAKPEISKTVTIPVLNYHSIGEQPGNSLVLTSDKFQKQMDYLEQRHYTPLTLSDFTQVLENRKEPPPNPVLLTFDDGYLDNYELVMPVLRKHGFPATLFMMPGFVGKAGYVNWQHVKQMQSAGWDIQPHGMTHPHLPKLSDSQQKEEIAEARRQIEQELGTTADIFCYPYGEFNKSTLDILKEAGFRYAFTIRQGRADSSQPPLQLKRIYVNGQDSLSDWIRKLSYSG